MEGSSPASATHIAAVQSHPFAMDLGSRTLRDLLAQVQTSQVRTDPLQALGSTLASQQQRSGMTTRSSVSYRRHTRSSARSVPPSVLESPPPITGLSALPPRFGTPPGAPPTPLFAGFGSSSAVTAAAQETRKRKPTATRATSRATKKRKTQPSPVASNLKKAPPGSEPPPVQRENSSAGLKNDCDYGEESSQPNCCICMCEPDLADVATINGCQHKFCFDCIEKWADRENTCPLCKVRFSKIDRVNKPKRKKGEPQRKSSKHVKMRDQRSIPESALEGLVASFSAAGTAFPPHSIARLLFAGMGTGFFDFGPTRLVRAREVHFENDPRPVVYGPRSDVFDEPIISSDDESETFHGFIDQMRRVHSRSVRLAVPNPQRFGSSPSTSAVAAASSARSYAVNMGERNAGNAHNPLEIDDSDDDDEVEVVEVVTSVE